MRALARVTACGRGQLVLTYSQNDNMECISAKVIHLGSTGGCVSIKSLGDNGVTEIDSDVINLSADRAGLLATDGGGGISLLTQGDEGIIQLQTVEGAAATHLILTPTGFNLTNGLHFEMGVVEVLEGKMILSMGDLLSNSILTLTPDSITLKVGEATLTLTAQGLSTKVGETTVEVGPNGVSEEAGSVSRELGPKGHTLVAGESSLAVGLGGLKVAGPTGSLAFDASGQMVSAQLKESADAMLNLQSPLLNGGS